MTEALGVERIVSVLLAVPRCQGIDARHVADHGFDVGFHEALSRPISWQQQQDVPALVLDLVGRCSQ